jgi:exodeoxyribonuclease VII large subunit
MKARRMLPGFQVAEVAGPTTAAATGAPTAVGPEPPALIALAVGFAAPTATRAAEPAPGRDTAAAGRELFTPTDAAVKVSPDGRQLAAAVAGLGLRLEAGLDRRVTTARERLLQLARARIFADPARIIGDRRTLLDQQARRLVRLATSTVAHSRERVAAAAGRLEAGSPLHLLARGWSVTWKSGDPTALKSVAGLAAGDGLITQLTDGRIMSRIESIDQTTPTAAGRDA